MPTSLRTRSYPSELVAQAQREARAAPLYPSPNIRRPNGPEQRQDPWVPPTEPEPKPFRVLGIQKELLKLPESRKERQERGTQYPQSCIRSLRENSETTAHRTFLNKTLQPFPGTSHWPRPCLLSPTHTKLHRLPGFASLSKKKNTHTKSEDLQYKLLWGWKAPEHWKTLKQTP